jgi:hypothetical protein
MATFKGPGSAPAENDIFTLLLIIATAFVVIATIVVALQFGSYYGFENLFHGPAVIQK